MEKKETTYLALAKQVDLLISNMDDAEKKLQKYRESLELLKGNSITLNNSLAEERKRREEAEKKWLRFFQLSLDILIIADFEGNCQHINPAFATILGYDQELFLESTWLEIVVKYVHPDDREDTLQAIKTAVSGNPLYLFENRCLCQNGSYKWLSWSIMPAVEESLLYATAREFTKQKEIMQQAEERAELFRRSIDSLNECVAIIAAVRDNEGKVIDFTFEYVNEAGCSFLGITKKEELKGKGMLQVLPQHQARGLFVKYCRVIETGQPEIFESFVCDQENHKWLDIRASKYGNDIVVAWRDITQRKLREEALKQEKDKVVELLECITEPFMALDTGWNFTYLNKKAEKYLGKDRHELLGKNMWEEFPETVGTNFYQNLRQVHVNKVPLSFETKELFIGEDFEAQAFPLKDGISIFAKNTTAKKRMEKAINQMGERFATVFHASPAMLEILSLGEKLYLDVNECWEKYTGYSRTEVIGKPADNFNFSGDPATKEMRNRAMAGETVVSHPGKYRTKAGELKEVLFSAEIIYIDENPCILGVSLDVTDKNRLQEEITRLNRLKLIGQMAAGISHEIRNPMTTIRGFLQLLSQKEKFQEEKPNFDLMISEVDRANQIITDFLSLSKTTPKELKLQDLNLLMEKLHPLLEGEASQQNKFLSIKTSRLPLLYLSENEIRQLVLNLFKNGLEAMQPKGTIAISTLVVRDNVVLLVEDEGHGIDESNLGKIGTPFFTTRDYGTGLGVAVCQSIVARHNGKIEYESDNSGTKVRVLLPIPKVKKNNTGKII